MYFRHTDAEKRDGTYVKGKADGWREKHHAVNAFTCQALFSIMDQKQHAFPSPCTAVGLDFYFGGLPVQPAPVFRSETALQSSFNALS